MEGNTLWKLLNLKMKNLVFNLMTSVGYTGVRGRTNKTAIPVAHLSVPESDDIILL